LTCQKEFLLFYMCQLWALHVVIKRQFFYIYLYYNVMQLVLCGVCVIFAHVSLYRCNIIA